MNVVYNMMRIILHTVLKICRTDAGVHSLCNAAHIDLQNRYDNIYNPDDIVRHVNRYLIKCRHNIR